MKKCTKCGEIKPLTEFYKRKGAKDGHQYACKVCHLKNSKELYLNNKDKYNKRIYERRRRHSLIVIGIKDESKCSKCPEDHVSCLEFHHRDPSKKEHSISNMLAQGRSLDKILEEIEKCEVLCSNCHKKLHYEEKNGSSNLVQGSK